MSESPALYCPLLQLAKLIEEDGTINDVVGSLREKLSLTLRPRIVASEKDLAEIPDNIKNNLEIKTVEWVEEVLSIALENSVPGLEMPQTKISRKGESKDLMTH